VAEFENAVDPLLYRNVLGHLPTGVSIIATVEDGRPVGLAAGSFFSVSLDPPLVGFCVTLSSSTWPVIERTRKFGVSVLADDQLEVCRRFATKDPDKFAGIPWAPAPSTGSPLITGAVAHIDCELHQQFRAGDHWIVVGAVRNLVLHRTETGALIFARGGYNRHDPLV
jgi:3-hydroxy-9,10-secoandrosta-1,3,5(10)-triene-9,17-dione monooxygenase reductase component